MVQLRWKRGTDRQIVELGRSLRDICASHRVPFLVNDRIDLALAIAADGVHLGVDDLPLEIARQIAPEPFIIGFSPERDDQIEKAQARGADYLGIGPFARTTTKPDAGHALGAVEFARRRAITELPVVAIGGLEAHNASRPIEAGADGIAVVSAILDAADPEQAAQTLRQST